MTMQSLKRRWAMGGARGKGARLLKTAWVGVLAFLLVSGATLAEAKKNPQATPVVEETPAPEKLGVNAPPEVKAILDKVEEAQTSVKDVQMELRMDVKDSVSNQKQSVRGIVKMKSPDKVFTHYIKPTEQFLYIDGPVLMMYQPDQAMVYKQSTAKGQPAYLGVGKELKRYSNTSRVSIIKDSNSEVVLLFVPDNGDAQYKRMKVTIRKKDWWPGKVEIDNGSMTSTAEFLKPVYNQGLPDSDFKFTPPHGVNVVEGEIF
jgi:outer membrane lipoprotein-sorting protein